MNETAYDDGWDANCNGTPREGNPKTDPDLRKLWFDGWDGAQVVREEWESSNHERCRCAV